MSEDKVERCELCKFWQRLSGLDLGKCRRFPPATPQVQAYSNEWCGEFKKAVEESAEEKSE